MFPAMFWMLGHATQPDAIHVTVDGVDRVAYAFAPSMPAAPKPPVVFMFHGHGGSAQRCIGHFGMEKRWPEAVIVYCDGLSIITAAGNGKGWQIDANRRNRDIKFFDALLPKVIAQYRADPKEVFAWGFSNGGMFIYTLWSMRADKFAAFCTSGSCIASDDIRLTTPMPAFVTVSGNDANVPTELQEQALESVKKVDRSSKTGTSFGDGERFDGVKPIVVWRYNGGHEFPFEGFPKLIEFFKSFVTIHEKKG